jgi:serine/threonine-protein kinase
MTRDVASESERENEREKDQLDPLIGELLASRYLIEQKLGEGAMGAVYRARHVKVGRPFAVKVLHRRLLEENKIAQRFAREAELAGRLHHPNVIGVVDVGETADGLRYMVMDFAHGEDLAELLTEAPFPPERIIHIVRQLLEGLYHAHEAGLIHRDFKPENVIVERDDHGTEVPRIVDFGISILREGGDSTDGAGRLTTNGLVLGTPHYMAPEQAVADPIDHRIDLFAMGIVVYEMLSGKLPFDGRGAEVARANLLLDPPPISQRVPYLEVDPLLEAFARRLMAKRRDHRPATAKKAREILDLIERDRPAAAAALGIPLEESGRMPKVTQPVAPQQRPAAPHATHQTAPARRLEASPAEAPPSEREAPGAPPAPVAIAAPTPAPGTFAPAFAAPPSRTDLPPTTMTDPLPWGEEPAARRRRGLIAGGIGLAAAGAVIAIILGAGGGDDPPAAPAKVAASAPPAAPPDPAPTAPPAPSEPAGSAAAPAMPATPPGPEATTEVQPPSGPDPGATKVEPDRPTPDRPTSPGRKPDGSAIKTKPDAGKTGTGKTGTGKPPAPLLNLAALDPDVTKRWKQVELAINKLKASPATRAEGERLYTRWGRIQIQTAQINEVRRTKDLAELAELARLVNAARTKQ